jgi:chromosome partitioning protein
MNTVLIAIAQGKGGASKTTTAVNLTGALNELGYKACLIDWDSEKPDASKWMQQGDFINWIKLIDNGDPVLDIETAKQKYDVVLFDTPPNYDANALKAIMTSDFVIIPTSTNFLDQENAKEAISVPMLAKKPFKILMSKIKKGTKAGKDIYAQVGDRDISFKEIISDRDPLAQCPRSGKWIGQYAKGSDSHKQFLNLAKEVVLWTGIKCHNRDTKLEEVIL